MKAGYIEWDKNKKKFIEPLSGVPQGGIISPLLSNLILHEFDTYMENLIKGRENMNYGIRREINNPIYGRLYRLERKIKEEMNVRPKSELKALRKEFRKTLRIRMRYKKLLPNPQ